MTYKGFQIKLPQGTRNEKSFMICKDGIVLSALRFGSIEAAMKRINTMAPETPIPETVDRVPTEYSNKQFV